MTTSYLGTESLNFDIRTISTLIPGLSFSTGSSDGVYIYGSTARLNLTDISQASNIGSPQYSSLWKYVETNSYSSVIGSDGNQYILKIVDPNRRIDGDALDGLTYNVWQVNSSNALQTYKIAAQSNTVSEGTTATFILTTNNIASGTVVNYILSGISPADVVGGLAGVTTVAANGITTINIGIISDQLYEGVEQLTLTVAGASANISIIDSHTGSPYDSSLLKYIGAESLNFDIKTISTLIPGLSFSTGSSDGVYIYGSTARLNLTEISQASNIGSPQYSSLWKYVETNSYSSVIGSDGNQYILKIVDPNRRIDGDGLDGLAYNVWQVNSSNALQTYKIAAQSNTVDEGSTATFTLTTTNVTSGTSVPYTLSGIGAADVSGGLLMGNAFINSSGVATISVTLLNDNLTEGTETLTVTAGGTTVSTVINDTSNSNASYALSAGLTDIDEGYNAFFILTTTNVASGTSVPYTLTGSINSADVSGGALSGNVVIVNGGFGYIYVSLINDNLAEDPETLTVTAGGASASTVINDTSKTPVVVPVVMGTTAKDSITNLPVSQMIDAGAGTDTLVYNSNSYDVLISKSGGSTLVTNTATGEVDTLSNVERIKFADTAIALDTSGVGGQAYRIYQAAFNRNPDFVGLGYWISGMDSGASLASVALGFVSSDEFKALYGESPTNAQIVTKFYDNVLHRAPDSGGYSYWLGMLNSGLSVSNALAAFSESAENVSGVSGAISSGIRYTPYVSPTYSMFASATSVNEGGVATFTLKTTNVAAGSSIPYSLSGISAADVLVGLLSGNAVVNSSGVATISVALLNDSLTEGVEKLQVTAGSATASINVNDTSISIVGTVTGPSTGGSGFGVGGGGVGGGG